MSERRGLTPEAVTDAAIDIVESEGAAALTLSRVARALGVKPPSLYSHVDGLEALRRDMAMRTFEDLGGRLGHAAMGRSGPEAIRALAGAMRDFAREHPGLYGMTTRARPDDEQYAAASMRPVEPMLAVLRGYDVTGDDAIHAARTFRAAVHGFVTLENDGGFGLDVGVDESFTWLVDHLIASLEARLAGATRTS